MSIDKQTIFEKTPKGALESKGRWGIFASTSQKVLALIDGISTVEQLLESSGMKSNKFFDEMENLLRDRLIRESWTPNAQFTINAAPHSRQGIHVTVEDTQVFFEALAKQKSGSKKNEDEEEELESFDDVEEKLRRESEQSARREEAGRQLQIEAKVKADAELKAREEEVRKTREAAELRGKEEAERRAQEESERKIRQEEELKARTEAQRKAQEVEEQRIREAAERKSKEDAERRVREEAERKAREEKEKHAREEAERRSKEEAARRMREEAERIEREARRAKRLEAREKEKQLALEAAQRKAQEEAERREREEAERKAKEEAERQARAEAERKAQEEAERREREEAERKAKEEAERQARAAAERKAQEEAALRAREEAERREREEAERKAKEEAERQAREAAERKAQEEAERREREEAELKAKEEAERQARAAAERKAQEEAERREREEAERKAKEEAERQAREAAEHKAQEEAERREREETERKAKEEAERQARAEAERKAQEEAVLRAREEAERAARIEAERKAQEEAERQARAEAERKAQEEAALRAREEAERKAKEEAERREREEAERKAKEETERQDRAEAERKAREEADFLAQEDAEREARVQAVGSFRPGEDIRELEEVEPGERAAKVMRILKWGAAGIAALLVVGLAGIHFVPLSSTQKRLETLVSARLGEPVKMSSLYISLFPSPYLKLKQLEIGPQAAIRVADARIHAGWGTLLGDGREVERIELENVHLAAGALERISNWPARSVQQQPAYQIGQITFRQAKIAASEGAPPPFRGELGFSNAGRIEKGWLGSEDGALKADFSSASGGLAVSINARNVITSNILPVGIDSLQAEGTVNGKQIRFAELNGTSHGGKVSGSLVLSWDQDWSAAGDVRIAGANIAPSSAASVAVSGKLDAALSFMQRAKTPEDLFRPPLLTGSVTLQAGKVAGFDLPSALHYDVEAIYSAHTDFDTWSFKLEPLGDKQAYKSMRMAGPGLLVEGRAEVSDKGAISGAAKLQVETKKKIVRGNYILGGTLERPTIRRAALSK